MWWGLLNLRPHLSEEDERKERKNQLVREIKEKKLRIKKLKQARKEQRAERFRSRMTDLKARIERVNIEGLGKTKDSLVVDRLAALFKAETFQDIIQTTKALQNDLKNLGCFRSVDIYVDTIDKDKMEKDTGEENYNDINQKSYQVNIKVEEIGSVFINLGIVPGNQENEVSFAVRGGLNNLEGGGERIELERTTGLFKSKQTILSIYSPLHNISQESRVYMTLSESRNPLPDTPVNQVKQVLSAGARINTSRIRVSSRLGLEHHSTILDFSSLRTSNIHRWHPVSSRCGDQLIATLHNSFNINFHDSSLLPLHGFRSFISHTAGLLPWSSSILFHQFKFGFSALYPILKSVSLSFSGFLTHTINSTQQGYSNIQVPLSYISGSRSALVFRGVDKPNQYAGDLTAAVVTASIISKLPLLREHSMLCKHTRVHGFITAHSHRSDGQLSLTRRDINSYIGIGIIGKISDIGRFELNYTVPLYPGFGKPGFKCSFGSQFL